MKKILILLSIMGASQAIVVNAASCETEGFISLFNNTEGRPLYETTLYFAVYKSNSERCSSIIAIKPLQRNPEKKSQYRSIPIPKTGFFSSAKVYLSNDPSDLKPKLTSNDIKELEKKGFKGFEVSKDKDYIIYPLNSKGEPDEQASRTKSITGAENTIALEDKLRASL